MDENTNSDVEIGQRLREVHFILGALLKLQQCEKTDILRVMRAKASITLTRELLRNLEHLVKSVERDAEDAGVVTIPRRKA